MTEKLDWRAAVWAGLIAGAVFMMVEMALVGTVGGASPWGPPRMIGARVMGQSVLPPPATFDAVIMMVAMVIHFLLSVLFGVVLGWAISRWRIGMAAALVAGLIFGLVVYFVDFYIMAAIFPWFAMARGAISISAHAIFGSVLGAAYRALAARRETARGERSGA